MCMKWIGLTGGIATGKSTVAKLFESQGGAVIDADAISHAITRPGEEGYFKVVSHFGNLVIDEKGFLNRLKLADIVFKNPEKKTELESLLHPIIQARVQEAKANYAIQGKKFCFYDVPLLFEKKLQSQFDFVVTVWCDEEVRLQRLMQRNGLEREAAELRIRQQMPQSLKISESDYCIDNSGSEQSLIHIVNRFLAQIEKNCGE